MKKTSLRISVIFLLSILPVIGFSQKPNYKIVFNVLENREKDNYEIYSMNMDGSERKNISNLPGVDWVYYAYGNKVYFVSDRDTCHRCYFLYEMDADGNHVRKISNLQLEDSWMGSRKKGTELIVAGRIGKQIRYQLFLINIKTGDYRQITTDTISTKADPIFLPDEKTIVLRYRPDKSLRQTVFDELWTMDLKGNSIRQLTNFPKNDTTTKWFEYHAGPPQWNPRYKFLSYLSRQKNQTQIYAVTLNGKNQWQITHDNWSSGWHSWSDDGEWLAMDRSSPDEKQFDIFLMHYKSGKVQQLTFDSKTEQAPVIVRYQ